MDLLVQRKKPGCLDAVFGITICVGYYLVFAYPIMFDLHTANGKDFETKNKQKNACYHDSIHSYTSLVQCGNLEVTSCLAGFRS